jgi:hypothetical protein
VRGAEVERWTLPAAPDTPDFFTSYGFPDEYRAFVRGVEGGERPAADFEYGWRFMRIVEGILGCESGGTVDIVYDGTSAHRFTGAPVGGNGVGHGAGNGPSSGAASGAVSGAVSGPSSGVASAGARASSYAAPPAVHILQAPSSQARFFPADLLSRASGVCNVTLRADDDRWRD